MMWVAIVIIVVIVCFTVDNMFENYLEAKYPRRKYDYKSQEDEDDEE